MKNQRNQAQIVVQQPLTFSGELEEGTGEILKKLTGVMLTQALCCALLLQLADEDVQSSLGIQKTAAAFTSELLAMGSHTRSIHAQLRTSTTISLPSKMTFLTEVLVRGKGCGLDITIEGAAGR